MTEHHRENLSAGVDGELTDDALRFLLRRMEHDTNLGQTWNRYHLIGDGLRGKLPPLASPDFAGRVMQMLEQPAEPVIASVTSGHARHWLRWSAGGVIAASVAVVALMANRPLGHAPNQPNLMTTAVNRSSAKVLVDTSTLANNNAPVRVPTWLSNNSADVSLLSEQAAATRPLPFGALSVPSYPSGLSAAPLTAHAPFQGDHRGDYLLLIDGQPTPSLPMSDKSPVTGARAVVH